jgi:hypothetical protein
LHEDPIPVKWKDIVLLEKISIHQIYIYQ